MQLLGRHFRIGQIAGAILIIAALVMSTGAATAIITFSLSPTGFWAAAEKFLTAISIYPSAWKLANDLILVAILLTAHGLITNNRHA